MGRPETDLFVSLSMVRRRLLEEPVSRLAVWARRFALFSIVVSVMSVVVVHSGYLEFTPAMATFGGALVFAGLSILLALLAMAVIWHSGHRGLGQAVLALMIGMGLLAYPGYLGAKAYRLPAINDVTTDPADPPRFEALASLRASVAPLPVRFTPDQHRAAYPDIEPLEVTVPAQAAFAAAQDVIAKHKWTILLARAPQPPRREGHIEAVARSVLMGFREDVIIRVRPTPDGARVDVRSASRYGKYDFGSNADRVRALVEEIDDKTSDDEKKAAKPIAKGQSPARGAKR
jgi:uncharacterized protein (DUF1499 family)